MTKDYVLHPLLSGPSAITTLTANLTANLVRNLWTHSVIMCGHFPEGVQTYEKESIDGVTRGDWCLRQMLGSANISGNRLLHLMTGNLSFQIEHHLFPDLPSNRYQEIAPKVQQLFERYGLTYVSGPMSSRSARRGRRFSGSRRQTTSCARRRRRLSRRALTSSSSARRPRSTPPRRSPRTEGRRFRLGKPSVRPEVRPSMGSGVDARVPAGQDQRR
jgi:fatty acid desaturase